MKNNQKIYAIVQARMNSSRLPSKVMKEILSKPVLGILIERLKDSKLLDGVIVATTKNKNDDVIEKYCKENNINIYRGSEEDLIERMLFAAKSYDADIIIEQGADCPLVDSELIDNIVKYYFDNDFDYVTTLNNKRTSPHGYFARVCSTKILEDVHNKIKDIDERAKGFFYIENHPEIYRIGNFISKGYTNSKDFRITIDTKKDFEFMSTLLERLNSFKVSMIDIVKFLKKNPELLEINKDENHVKFKLNKIGIVDVKGRKINKLNYDLDYKEVKEQDLIGFRLVALCSSNEETLKENGKNLGISRLYKNYEEMLEKENLDVLILYGKSEDNKIIDYCRKNNLKLISTEENFEDLIKNLYKHL
ncbi:MAG: hypothetical protein AABX61_00970 [Nanoarchaeota archaeon]